jgi:hypothetical protein
MNCFLSPVYTTKFVEQSLSRGVLLYFGRHCIPFFSFLIHNVGSTFPKSRNFLISLNSINIVWPSSVPHVCQIVRIPIIFGLHLQSYCYEAGARREIIRYNFMQPVNCFDAFHRILNGYLHIH